MGRMPGVGVPPARPPLLPLRMRRAAPGHAAYGGRCAGLIDRAAPVEGGCHGPTRPGCPWTTGRCKRVAGLALYQAPPAGPRLSERRRAPTHRSPGRLDLPGCRHRLPRRSRSIAAMAGSRRHGRGRHGARRGGLDPRSLCESAATVHAASPQSRTLGRNARSKSAVRIRFLPRSTARPSSAI